MQGLRLLATLWQLQNIFFYQRNIWGMSRLNMSLVKHNNGIIS